MINGSTSTSSSSAPPQQQQQMSVLAAAAGLDLSMFPQLGPAPWDWSTSLPNLPNTPANRDQGVHSTQLGSGFIAPNISSSSSNSNSIKSIVQNLNEKINKLYNWHLIELDLISKQQLQVNALRGSQLARGGTTSDLSAQPDSQQPAAVTAVSDSAVQKSAQQPVVHVTTPVMQPSQSTALQREQQVLEQQRAREQQTADVLQALQKCLFMLQTHDPHAEEIQTLQQLLQSTAAAPLASTSSLQSLLAVSAPAAREASALASVGTSASTGSDPLAWLEADVSKALAEAYDTLQLSIDTTLELIPASDNDNQTGTALPYDHQVSPEWIVVLCDCMGHVDTDKCCLRFHREWHRCYKVCNKSGRLKTRWYPCRKLNHLSTLCRLICR